MHTGNASNHSAPAQDGLANSCRLRLGRLNRRLLLGGGMASAILAGFFHFTSFDWIAIAAIMGQCACLCILGLAQVNERPAPKARARLLPAAGSREFAEMTHELRTPLTAIIGFSEMIKSNVLGSAALGDGALTRYQEYAGHIHDSGSEMLELVNSILDAAKLDSGSLNLNEEWIDLDQAITRAMDTVGIVARKHELTLNRQPQTLQLELKADRRLISQMLLNLLSNAIKFTPKGGRISIETKNSEAGLTIAIKDSGIGIRREDLTLVLEPFGQATPEGTNENSDKDSTGTGLGLPLVKAWMEMHSGALNLDSRPGKGTTAMLIFPSGRVRKPDQQQLEFGFSPSGLASEFARKAAHRMSAKSNLHTLHPLHQPCATRHAPQPNHNTNADANAA